MVKSFIAFLFSCFISITIYADNRNILIFLDDSESGVGAITGDLMVALSQKPGPILVSSSLLKNIFSPYDGELKNKDSNYLAEKYAGALHGDDQGLKYILGQALSFDKNEWVIKSVGSSLTLLLPISHLVSLGLSEEQVSKNLPGDELSDTEIILGLKVNHQKTVVDIFEAGQSFAVGSSDADYFLEALNNNLLFVTRAEYKGFLAPHAWSIFMQGHGVYRQSIAGIRLHKFSDVLNFFAAKIDCYLLVYSSCYAAGANSEAIFSEQGSVVKKHYPYTIITQAITDAPTIALTPKVQVTKSGQLRFLETDLNFAKFVEEVVKPESIDYQKAIKHLTATPQLYGDYWANLPQIRMPGTSWFSVLAHQKEVVSIGTILAKSRSASLDIVKYFKTDPKALLLYTVDIPFELIIDAKNIDTVISMIPGDTITTMSKISSRNKKSSEIIDLFMKIDGMSSKKIFHINKINELDDVVIYLNKISGGKFSSKDVEEKYACFYEQGQLYSKDLYGEKKRLDVADARAKNCLNILNKLKGKTNEIDVIDLSKRTISNYDRFIPDIDDNTVINKIIAPNLSFLAIELGVSEKLKKGHFLWVKELIVQAHEKYLDLAGVKAEQVITLQDVIFDSRAKASYYYTYQGRYYQDKKLSKDYRDEFRKDWQAPSVQEIPSQLPLSITKESIEAIKKLQEVLLKKARPAKKKRMTSIELDAAVNKLSDADRNLGRDFVDEITNREINMAKILPMIQEMKTRNLLNSVLPLRYNKSLNLALQRNAPYEIIKTLLDYGALLDDEIFNRAMQGNVSLKTLQLLVDKGGVLDEEDDLLYRAIYNDSPQAHEIVRWLLQKGLNADGNLSPDNKLMSPLNYALFRRHYDIAKTLLEHGASATRKDFYKDSPLDFAIQAENERDVDKALTIIKMLIERGVRVTEQQVAKAKNATIKKYLEDAIKK